MYEQFYGIIKNPFSLTPDPRFLVMTQAHREVKAALTYAILSGKGFTVLTGEAGTGKTTLLRAVVNSIPKEQLCFSFLVNPVLTPDEFYDIVLDDFGLPRCTTKAERLKSFLEFLLECRAAGRVAVLFVDEAHRLSIEMLEEIRLLTNFETEVEKLLHIVLVGQDELDELLDRRELRQLKQRIEVRQHIGPLAMDEIPSYIGHRWSCAGGSNCPFSPEAIRQIGKISHGIPRLINSLCDNALLLGFAESAAVITEAHVTEVSQDLRLNGHSPLRSMIETKPASKAAAAAGDGRVSKLELTAPKPVSHLDNPLSIFQRAKPKRSWWARSSRAEEA